MRTRIRDFIEELLEAELDAALARKRYERPSLAETEAVAQGWSLSCPRLSGSENLTVSSEGTGL